MNIEKYGRTPETKLSNVFRLPVLLHQCFASLRVGAAFVIDTPKNKRNLPEHVHDISAVFCVRPSSSTPPLPMRRARGAEQGEAFEQLNAAVPRWVVWQIPRNPMLNAYRSSTVQVCSVRRSSSPNSWLNLGKISVQGERAKFTGLVLGCIEAKFCK